MTHPGTTILRATDVFTPNKFPTHTYIERQSVGLEEALREGLETPNTVISLSGPSKSGKTVLAERIIGIDNLINVSGAELTSGQDLWDRVFDILDQPVTTTGQETTTRTTGGSAEIAAEAGTSFLAKITGKMSAQHSRARSQASGETRGRRGLAQAEALLRNTPAVIFIDDFHYMTREVQTAVAKQIRAASGRGIKICAASVPHRSDDVVRSNHELRGRTTHIDTAFWSVDDLAQIAAVGFPLLRVKIANEAVQRLATEACGSPQLMQQVCLQTCYYLKVRTEQDVIRLHPLTADDEASILRTASSKTDYSSLLKEMHGGPRTRGTDRTALRLVDGSSGDVYRAVLLGLATGTPLLSIPYPKLIEQTNRVTKAGKFTAQSIQSAVKKMAEMARKMYPTERVIEWDDAVGRGTLSIVDPYLLFYIRNSGKLSAMD